MRDNQLSWRARRTHPVIPVRWSLLCRVVSSQTQVRSGRRSRNRRNTRHPCASIRRLLLARGGQALIGDPEGSSREDRQLLPHLTTQTTGAHGHSVSRTGALR